MFPVEEDAFGQTMFSGKGPIVVSIEPVRFDVQTPEQGLGRIRILTGLLKALAAAVAEQSFAVHRKLIPLGVPAEVVMIVQNKDTCAGAETLTVEPGGRETGNSAADHDEIIIRSRLLLRARPACATKSKVMGNFERSGMTSAHSLQARRVGPAD